MLKKDNNYPEVNLKNLEVVPSANTSPDESAMSQLEEAIIEDANLDNIVDSRTEGIKTHSSENDNNLVVNPRADVENVLDINWNYFGPYDDSKNETKSFQEDLLNDEYVSDLVYVPVEEAEEATEEVSNKKENKKFSAFQEWLSDLFCCIKKQPP